MNPKKILIQGAMDSEICLLVNALSDRKDSVTAGFPFFEGIISGRHVIIQKTFQGMVNAAAATITAITNYSPDIIINQGICGGHDPALHRGDILIGAEIFPYSNLKIGSCSGENPLNGCSVIGLEPLSGCSMISLKTRGGCGTSDTKAAATEKSTLFYSDPTLVARAQSCPAPADNVRIFTGRIGSADAWLDRKDLIRHMHETFHTSGEDMESAAVAQLCFSFDIPFLSLRTLSNTLVHDEEYDETTAAMIQQFTLSFLNGN